LPNGLGVAVSTSTIRIRRAAMSRSSPVRAGTSNTSCRHSLTVSRTMGNAGYLLAISRSWAERCRCCQSGVRRPGCRLGSSKARLAHSRNLDANSALAPTSAVTSSPISSGSSSAIPVGGGSSESGTLIRIPSSVCSACTSIPPYRSRSLAAMASAHGACTRSPYGLCRTTRQSPSSSRNRSTTSVRSSGTYPVAARWSARYRSRFRAASSSSPACSSFRVASGSVAPASSRQAAPMARPSSAGRPGVSPCQNGSRPG
jgi:hypothetical protein